MQSTILGKNAPDKELFYYDFDLSDKLKYEKDTKVPNSGTFTIKREDHTLGNLVRNQLLKNKNVLFAGYKMPHPLENTMLLRVQTSPETDPVTAVTESLIDLRAEVTLLEERFKTQLENFVQN